MLEETGQQGTCLNRESSGWAPQYSGGALPLPRSGPRLDPPHQRVCEFVDIYRPFH